MLMSLMFSLSYASVYACGYALVNTSRVETTRRSSSLSSVYTFDKARWITVGLQSCLDVIKFSTASSLLHRALNLPNSSEGKKQELNYVQAALESNGYPSSFIKSIHARKTRASTTNVSPEELVGMFFKMVEPTESRKSFASLSYITLLHQRSN